MDKRTFTRFRDLLKKSRKVVIVTHSNPDGDAMGSSLGLFHYLKKLKKDVRVVIPNASPDFLAWLPGNRQVIDYTVDAKKAEAAALKADLVFTLDFNSFKRIERLGEVLSRLTAPKVIIDHHPGPDDYATISFHDEKACSTSELVYRLIEGMGDAKKLDRKIASSLYTGIMTDTGSFRYPCVKAETHRIVAALLETGIRPNDIHSEVYDSYSLHRMRLLGFALSEKLRVVEGTSAAYIALSEEELKRYNFQKGDTEGLVNYPFMIKGVTVCAMFTGAPEFVRVSLRSKGKTDVNKYARQYFNGGGHVNAAGGRSYASLEETVRKYEETVKTLF
jgi:bifunctional oligoribonuclease and PAP phosphatase NrnA